MLRIDDVTLPCQPLQSMPPCENSKQIDYQVLDNLFGLKQIDYQVLDPIYLALSKQIIKYLTIYLALSKQIIKYLIQSIQLNKQIDYQVLDPIYLALRFPDAVVLQLSVVYT